MLQVTQPGRRGADDWDPPLPEAGRAVGLDDILGFLRRQWFVLAGGLVAGLALAVAYLAVAGPLYSATARLLIDGRGTQVAPAQRAWPEAPIDSAGVDSHVEIIRSETIALATVDRLGLAREAEFAGSGPGLFGGLPGIAGRSSGTDARGRAAAHLLDNLRVRRVGLSHVIDISYRSSDPDRAAMVANAVAEAYIADQIEAKTRSTRRATAWLRDRLAELRRQASLADAAVQDYKARNNIVDTGRGLVVEQQLAEINSQLVLARAEAAEARARLERIEEIVRPGLPAAQFAEALQSPVITKLRQQHVEAAKREADWSRRYGAGHAAIANLRSEMKELERAMGDEVGRIAESHRTSYEIARAREEALQASLDGLASRTAGTNRDRVVLRELESSAETSRALHASFLQRFMETTQHETFPTTEARLITAATRPLSPSHPKPFLVGGVFAALGLSLGLCAGLLREQLDRVFRTAADVGRVLGLDCLGLLPLIETDSPAPQPDGPAGPALARDLGILRAVVEMPRTRFAETVRAIRLAIDLDASPEAPRAIGIVSALPGEGKTTVAANLAQLLAHGMRRVLLVDADLRHPRLSASLAPPDRRGLLDVLAGTVSLEDALLTDPLTGLDFLPAGTAEGIPHSSEVLSSQAMTGLVGDCRRVYDAIVLDLPPLSPVVDARAASRLVDAYVLVIGWGRTPFDTVAGVLRSAGIIRHRMLGAVLNQARLGANAESADARYTYAE